MTKISSYAAVTPVGTDLLIGTDTSASDATKNFTVQSIVDLALVSDPYKGFDKWQNSASATPIAVSPGVWANLTNDGLGTETTHAYMPSGVTGYYWNSASSYINLSELPLGKIALIRYDFKVTPNSSNQTLLSRIVQDPGGASERDLHLIQSTLQSSGAENRFSVTTFLAISDEAVGDPIYLQVKLSGDGTVSPAETRLVVTTF
jgi:hypothetical protein